MPSARPPPGGTSTPSRARHVVYPDLGGPGVGMQGPGRTITKLSGRATVHRDWPRGERRSRLLRNGPSRRPPSRDAAAHQTANERGVGADTRAAAVGVHAGQVEAAPSPSAARVVRRNHCSRGRTIGLGRTSTPFGRTSTDPRDWFGQARALRAAIRWRSARRVHVCASSCTTKALTRRMRSSRRCGDEDEAPRREDRRETDHVRGGRRSDRAQDATQRESGRVRPRFGRTVGRDETSDDGKN